MVKMYNNAFSVVWIKINLIFRKRLNCSVLSLRQERKWSERAVDVSWVLHAVASFHGIETSVELWIYVQCWEGGIHTYEQEIVVLMLYWMITSNLHNAVGGWCRAGSEHNGSDYNTRGTSSWPPPPFRVPRIYQDHHMSRRVALESPLQVL